MYGPKWPCLLMYMSHEIDAGTDCSFVLKIRYFTRIRLRHM